MTEDDDPMHWDHGQLLRDVRRLRAIVADLGPGELAPGLPPRGDEGSFAPAPYTHVDAVRGEATTVDATPDEPCGGEQEAHKPDCEAVVAAEELFADREELSALRQAISTLLADVEPADLPGRGERLLLVRTMLAVDDPLSDPPTPVR
jgi:hypothetical protein